MRRVTQGDVAEPRGRLGGADVTWMRGRANESTWTPGGATWHEELRAGR